MTSNALVERRSVGLIKLPAALLTKLSIENLLHPFQTFILGQFNLAPRISAKFKIPLIIYGEAPAEYGSSISENEVSLKD